MQSRAAIRERSKTYRAALFGNLKSELVEARVATHYALAGPSARALYRARRGNQRRRLEVAAVAGRLLRAGAGIAACGGLLISLGSVPPLKTPYFDTS